MNQLQRHPLISFYFGLHFQHWREHKRQFIWGRSEAPRWSAAVLYLRRRLMCANGTAASSKASRCSCQLSPLLSRAESDGRCPEPCIRLANGRGLRRERSETDIERGKERDREKKSVWWCDASKHGPIRVVKLIIELFELPRGKWHPRNEVSGE